MTVKQRTWRFASLLAAAVIAGTTAALPADDLPWSFNGSYQTVGYPVSNSYVTHSAWYVPTYSAPVSSRTVSSRQSSGCDSCSANSSYAPMSYYAPAYGYGSGCGCGPVAVAPSCSPCGVSCNMPLNSCDSGCSSSPTPAKPAQSKGSSSGFHPTQKKNEPEANRSGASKQPMQTFVEQSNSSTTDVESPAINDGLGGNQRIRKLQTDEQKEDVDNILDGKAEVRKPASSETSEETVIEKIKKVPAPVEIDVNSGDEAQSPAKPADDLKLNSDGEAKIQLPIPQVNFDDKIASRAESSRTRIPLHVKVGKVSVARRTPNAINSDWMPIATKHAGPQLVKK